MRHNGGQIWARVCSTPESYEDSDMKKIAQKIAPKFALWVIIPVALTACAAPSLPTAELQQMKPACAGGDAAVCADIGHTIRRDRAEASYAAAPS